MEIAQNILVKIKNSLRRSHNKLDDDLLDTILACLRDLEVYGIQVKPAEGETELDPLILNAVKLYCKAEDVDDPVKAAAFRARYDALKASLGMADEYKQGGAAND